MLVHIPCETMKFRAMCSNQLLISDHHLVIAIVVNLIPFNKQRRVCGRIPELITAEFGTEIEFESI